MKRTELADKSGKLLNICCIGLTVLLLIGIAFRIMLPAGEPGYFFGYRLGFVVSDSMEPAIPTYSLLIEKEYYEGESLLEGDIISFYPHVESSYSSLRITHRIVEINDDGIITKGDNNELPDPYILGCADVRAKVVGIIPYFLPIVCIAGGTAIILPFAVICALKTK